VKSYITIPNPTVYNNSPTTGPLCEVHSGVLACSSGASLLFDHDIGNSELNTGKVHAWDRDITITFVIQSTKVRKVNLFCNIPSSGIGLPPSELFWGNIGPLNPNIPLSHVILCNQDLSQDDRTFQNVSLVVTTDQGNPQAVPTDYRFFRIHFTFTAETSLIDWILLSEVQHCGEAGIDVSVFPMEVLQLVAFRWTC